MKAGILGLSLAGKSTLFQLLTGTPATAPGGRPEARLGMARVPDPRVARLGEIFQPKKQTLATVEYVDVPGVAKGEGAALVDLPALRGVDALVHVVRAFESETAPHPDGSTPSPSAGSRTRGATRGHSCGLSQVVCRHCRRRGENTADQPIGINSKHT
jgi:ribosome-binding ATPase YchF (GTP1/OBG family)